ncbi:MAG: hypothetical protein EOO40_05775 [Deltaproteobacteria bacterium]|nr:MAG: hypothetical protein EOO40_05775 [Deltaproteobacteria bacterium]
MLILVPAPLVVPATLVREVAQCRDSLAEARRVLPGTVAISSLSAELADIEALAQEMDIASRADDTSWKQIEYIISRAELLRSLQQQLHGLRPQLRRLAKKARGAADNGDFPRSPDVQVPQADEAQPADPARSCTPTLLQPLFAAPPDGRGQSLHAFVEMHFDCGTFASAWDSAVYHFNKHARATAGMTLRKYIEQALAARSEHDYLLSRRLSDSNAFLKMVDSPQTFLLFSEAGRIVSYRNRAAAKGYEQGP